MRQLGIINCSDIDRIVLPGIRVEFPNLMNRN